MKIAAVLCAVLILSGCYTSQDRWRDFARKHDCTPTGRTKVLLAGSIYSPAQRRVVHEFDCAEDQRVWSDLGSYGRWNEWLTI